MKATTVIKKATKGINQFYNPRSAWDKGVKTYAVELLEKLQEQAEGNYITLDDLYSVNMLNKAMLNGAENWVHYSEGGNAIIWDEEIMQRLCNASEFKKYQNGKLNTRETPHQIQGRALFQAANLVKSYIKSYL